VNGDLVAEGLEVAYGTGCAFAGVVPAVVVRSWVLVVGAGAEHVPDGGEDCSFDRDDGSEFSAAGGDASVLGAEVGVALSGCRHGGGAKGSFEVAVPGSGGAVLRRPADSCCPGLTPVQEHRWAAVGKAVMSAPVSAMMMSATVRLTQGCW
jgi:hypothetical protein